MRSTVYDFSTNFSTLQNKNKNDSVIGLRLNHKTLSFTDVECNLDAYVYLYGLLICISYSLQQLFVCIYGTSEF